MESLDLIITDTSMAHLAGPLVRPTWVALSMCRIGVGCSRDDSPWYPTMRLSAIGEG